MKNPNSFKKGKYTLLYSQESLKYWSATRAITNDGVEVEYTCMTNEKEEGNWQNWYKFEDTQVVGYIDDAKQVVF